MTGSAAPDSLTGIALAIALIEEFAETLNVKGSVCAGCNRVHYEKWTERQLQVELAAMTNKLKSIPQRLAAMKGTER